MPSSGRPDFVILGVPHSDGKVMVLASTELREAELQYEAEYAESLYLSRPERVWQEYRLTTRMHGYVMVIGDSYPDALSKLFGQWSPSEHPQDVLDAVVRRVDPSQLRAIEGG